MLMAALIRPMRVLGGMVVIVIVWMFMSVMMMMAVVVATGRCLPAGHQAELDGRHARPEHPVGTDVAVLDGEAAERGPEARERKAEIEQRAEHHVARRPREAVEIHRPGQLR
jgi:hypothetical protein